MSKFKVLAALGAAVGALAGLVAPAGAETVVTKACHFDAVTTALTPATPWVGGSGSFAFSGPGTCVSNTGLVQVEHISANGTYTSIVCGTGTWDIVATTYAPDMTTTFYWPVT